MLALSAERTIEGVLGFAAGRGLAHRRSSRVGLAADPTGQSLIVGFSAQCFMLARIALQKV
jgi:hypothetical protein